MCKLRQKACLLLVGALLVTSLSGCLGKSDKVKPADYGSMGSDLAVTFATSFPFRSPSSDQEAQAANWLAEQFTKLGYETAVIPFDYKDSAGNDAKSQNVVAKLKGKGFKFIGSGEKPDLDGRWIVIGAHYDVSGTASQADGVATGLTETGGYPTWADYNGIHDNASGVATLLTAAKAMKEDPPGYDVEFVAFGAGVSSFAGAAAHLATIAPERLAKLDAMYNVSSIYAGDKVYASAGQNSVIDEATKSYEKRRKLYEATDVFYTNTLTSHNGFSLYTNQASYMIEAEINGKAGKAIYREWTIKKSDHTPYDLAGIPIVFFESGDYAQTAATDPVYESKNPMFQDSKGYITGTVNDSSVYLARLFDQMAIFGAVAPAKEGETVTTTVADNKNLPQLTKRINNVAFIIVKAAQRKDNDTEMR